ncbi:hypothetical protein D9757_005974 [Collybiopsis confluens]|uniref:P-loop containing nucleoside triphosphate hydrolase protein n=1 Tax=Collybiopsis confluens TaxID=2823264 RepID=A0A8H5HUZ0_9AGAR|nr:hypothetical protein D9757_005974 [Collybiopsis confluens]
MLDFPFPTMATTTQDNIQSIAIIPGFLALFSLAILGTQLSVRLVRRKWWNRSDSSEPALTVTPISNSYKVLRFVGCSCLSVLTAFPSTRAQCVDEEKPLVVGFKVKYVLLFTYAYATLLALISLATKSARWFAVLHASFERGSAGHLAVAVPRLYIPVDPKYPMPDLNPEQTASLFSLGFFFFLDPVVFEAYRVPHLPLDRLPPLADSDSIKNLKERHFKDLDPFSGARSRNYLFNLIRSFPYEVMLLWALGAFTSLFMIFEPAAINGLLRFETFSLFSKKFSLKKMFLDRYLEQGEETSIMRPWFWVLVLFLNPLFDSLMVEWFLRVSLQMLVRMEALLTQLVFEHALRIRVKAETSSGTGSGSDADKVKRTNNLIGKINNLVTTDLAVINDARNCIALVSEIPMLLVFSSVFLYTILGWSAFVGIGVTIVMAPIPIYVSGIVRKYQVERMMKTDARVHILTDVVNVFRMVKMFGWESQMLSKVSEAREAEIRILKKRMYISLTGHIINFSIPIVAMAGTYATYVRFSLQPLDTLVMKQPLTASAVFSSLVVFENLQRYGNAIFMYWTRALAAKVSFDRITEFLNETELLDIYDTPPGNANTPTSDLGTAVQHPLRNEIGFQNASFSWYGESDGTTTPSGRRFVLKIDDKLTFKRGCLNLVTGPTGSGKTSLLLALLGEMHFVPPGPQSYFHLPREGGVAYFAQESWVQNETIKNNIIFASEYEEDRYKEVIYACGLERDLELFEAGDETEVGEKGLTLSGGQKARVTLARAIYSSADVILLDDVLAALDVHTSKWIVEKCLAGNLVKDRTVILVTHNVKLVEPIASSVTIVEDGRIVEHRSCTPVPSSELPEALPRSGDEESGENLGDKMLKDKSTSNGKLVVGEEIQEGRISGSAVKLYTSAVGGTHPVFYLSVLLGMLVLTHLMGVVQTWFLGYWASQYELPDKVPVMFFLGVYVAILAIVIASNAATSAFFISGTLRGCRRIHEQLADVILGTTLKWLDKTPTSRILTRFTQDINSIDSIIPAWTKAALDQTMKLTLKLAAIVILTPLFLIPGVAALAAGYTCAQIYLKSQMAVKREMSVAKSPVLGHFGATVAGLGMDLPHELKRISTTDKMKLVSIRAYNAQTLAIEELLYRIDRYSRSARIFYNLQRWMAIRMHIISALFIGSLSWYLVYVKNDTASNTGFSINMGVTFTGAIFGWIININMLEGQSVSLERVDAYMHIEQEPKPTDRGKPPAYWPASGELQVDNLSAKYSPDGPYVLHDLSFHIRSGERIGIVGRTGSGKSSLALSLLRCIYTTGDVVFDGIPTASVNLDSLRSSITIIPQVPELVSGTLRQNLDPFEELDDLTLNSSLKAAGLTALQEHLPEDEGKITLDTAVSGGGSNLSVGQRQIIALARNVRMKLAGCIRTDFFHRAMVRRSKLVILDEATSAIDYKTDNIIQTSLRTELSGATVITIAHRLQTVLDSDRIMVLDAGRLIEFGAPAEMLRDKNGKLRELVDESSDKEALLKLAERSGL